ncbi:hypothetical protein FA13DRAFT_1751822 [Coprinellus micaceus]|uniref:Actin-like ATPase domain-containing protein n=1 Tax=Coprinellus micaceus TaxID=71717 RepID=A0A4Y7TUU6_COPMI|nr:hypothetical protein FA13DRAFT_1751822 [Coprinellus micaceus]
MVACRPRAAVTAARRRRGVWTMACNIEQGWDPARSTYDGPKRKLILAFDVGTTYSGVSVYVPEIRGVTRFPAQEHVGGDCKIPSLMYYDKDGEVRAAGAEAIREEMVAMKEEEGWVSTPWFKLHLRPKSGMGAIPDAPASNIPDLPPNKTAVQVLADFMKYLYKCTRTYIEETHIGFSRDQIDFVLSHPNGWEGAQQEQMRRAAVLAGLVPSDEDAGSRITFVTEGEASLHFCLRSGLGVDSVIGGGDGVLIVDAGGGTVDMRIGLRRFAAPEWPFLEAHLKNSKFTEDVPRIAECFDNSTKLRFRNPSDPQYIRFGGLRLEGEKVGSFFQPSVNCIIASVKGMVGASKKTYSGWSIFLVGGFGASDYLGLRRIGLNVLRPDTHVNKAVADGAISFYLDHQTHKCRKRRSSRRSYFEESDFLSNFTNVSITLDCYRGSVESPRWMDVDAGSDGRLFYKANFDIILLFGLTELKAQVCWKEKGVEKRSPAKIVYEPGNALITKGG